MSRSMRGRQASKQRTDDDDGDDRLSVSAKSVSTKGSRPLASLTRIIQIDERNMLVFAKCDGRIMLPWFSIAMILDERDEEKMNEWVRSRRCFSSLCARLLCSSKARQFGFRPVIIDPLSHPLLCSELLKLKLVPSLASQMSLYSIDCARKMLRMDDRTPSKIYELLDQARLAEASNDHTFWNKSGNVTKRVHSHAS